MMLSIARRGRKILYAFFTFLIIPMTVPGLSESAGAAPLPDPTLRVEEKQLTVNGGPMRYQVVYPSGFDPSDRYPAVLGLSGGDASADIVDYCYGAMFRSHYFHDRIIILPILGETILPQRSDEWKRAMLQAIADAEPLTLSGWIALGTSNGGAAAFQLPRLRPDLFEGIITLPGYFDGSAVPEEWADYTIVMGVGENDPDWAQATDQTIGLLEGKVARIRTMVFQGQGHVLSPDYNVDPFYRLYFEENPDDMPPRMYDTVVALQTAPFNGAERRFSIVVPYNYDPARQYGVIVGLHGFQMDPRAMANALRIAAGEMDAVVICPDGNGNRHDDDFGGEEIRIVDEALAIASERFSVDPSRFYLSGFSWGGREALYYGLRSYEAFRGVVVVAPAIQSRSDADNDLNGLLPEFEYENAPEIPVCMIWGDNDVSFRSTIPYVHEHLVEAGGRSDTHIVAGIAHTFLYTELDALLLSCFRKIEQGNASAVPSDGWKSDGKAASHVVPQPMDEQSSILLPDLNAGTHSVVHLYDGAGRLVRRFEADGARILIARENLSPGIYHYVVATSSGREIRGRLAVR